MSTQMHSYLKTYYTSWQGINRLYEDWATAHQLSCFAAFTLYTLYNGEGPVSPRHIAEEWSFPKQTVHSILQNFAKQGYVTMAPDSRDKRGKAVALTEAGRLYAAPILADLQETELRALQYMDESQCAALAESNFHFFKSLQKAMNEETSP